MDSKRPRQILIGRVVRLIREERLEHLIGRLAPSDTITSLLASMKCAGRVP